MADSGSFSRIRAKENSLCSSIFDQPKPPVVPFYLFDKSRKDDHDDEAHTLLESAVISVRAKQVFWGVRFGGHYHIRGSPKSVP